RRGPRGRAHAGRERPRARRRNGPRRAAAGRGPLRVGRDRGAHARGLPHGAGAVVTAAGSGRVDEASRRVAAAPKDVYEALVDQDALVVWLPPEGMTGRFERFDLRPGGSYRMVLAYDDPDADPGKTGEGTDVVDVAIVDL